MRRLSLWRWVKGGVVTLAASAGWAGEAAAQGGSWAFLGPEISSDVKVALQNWTLHDRVLVALTGGASGTREFGAGDRTTSFWMRPGFKQAGTLTATTPSTGALRRWGGLTAGPTWNGVPRVLNLPRTLPEGTQWNSASTTPESEIGPGEAFLFSLVLPGLTQYRMGKRRWLAYTGMELLSAVLYLDASRDAQELKSQYRDFAWEQARMGFSAGARQDGDFDYYEVMSQWQGSGAWDADPQRAGLQPEADPMTYNGSIWRLATQIYSVNATEPEASPGYSLALEYYQGRAYGPEFLWMWRPGADDQGRFGRLITSSDERFRDARRALWMVAANHLMSGVDGFVMARLSSAPGGRTSLTVAVTF